MVWAAYNGLPLGLENVGAVLGFEKQKLKEGRDLIKYFCCPCKPTKKNGGRTWNLPHHDPEKWELFKKYNERDVQVEMQIQERLKNYPVPNSVWDEYHLDQEINDRGIMIDQDMVAEAIRIDELSRTDLIARMQRKTGTATVFLRPSARYTRITPVYLSAVYNDIFYGASLRTRPRRISHI